jgi:hypothetical protein
MSDWPKYRSHKIVQAARIVEIVKDVEGERILMVQPQPGGLTEPFKPTVREMGLNANVGDYAVIYDDDGEGDYYRSVSPASTFEKGYTQVSDADGEAAI